MEMQCNPNGSVREMLIASVLMIVTIFGMVFGAMFLFG